MTDAMQVKKILLTTNLISRIHAHSLSALGAVQAAGRLASAKHIDMPGVYRQGPVIIKNSPHIPPAADAVEVLTQALCDYLNFNWYHMDPVDIAGIVLWRINWIHPFRDGNGRTARALTRYVLTRSHEFNYGVGLDREFIYDRNAYYHALRSEDAFQKNTESIKLPGPILRSFIDDIIKKHKLGSIIRP